MGHKSETNPDNEQNNFEYIFKELRKQLIKASVHFDIVEKLWPTEQVVDILNRYIGFFRPTREAHFDSFILKVSDILNERNKRSPTFYRVLKMISNNPNLAPSINVQEIEERLGNHKTTIRKITDYRNKQAAHNDTKVTKRYPVRYGESKRLLEELKETFTEISRSHSKDVWSFRSSQQGDTDSLLEALKKQLAQDQELLDNLKWSLK